MNLFPSSDLLFISFLSLTLLVSITPYTVNEYEIRDLESTSTYFQTEAMAWTITNKGSSTDNATNCDNTWLLGGYQVGGSSTIYQRTYSSLPSHNAIYFSLLVWVLDLSSLTVDSGALYELYFDSVLIGTMSSLTLRTTATVSYCGSTLFDYPNIPTTGQIAHSASSVTIQIQAVIPSGAVTFGFRDVNLLFLNSSSSVTDNVCEYTAFTSIQNSCLCGADKYDTALLVCASCDGGCTSCTGPSAQECMSCASGYSFDGIECFQCASGCTQCESSHASKCITCDSSSYLYWNATCLGSCSSPLVNVTSGDQNICNLPCNSGEYYYLNDTICRSACDTPLVSGSLEGGALLTCDLPCSSGNYLYWNASCENACNTPLIAGTKNGVLTCSLPCATGDFYYPNDTICRSACDTPLLSGSLESGALLTCNLPCSSGNYLYWNASCENTCNPPLIAGTKNGVLTCSLPCNTGDFYYLNDTTCRSACDTPLLSGSQEGGALLTCNLPCSSGNYLYWNGSCANACNTPLITGTKNGVLTCALPCVTGDFYYLNDTTCHNACDAPLLSGSLEGGALLTCDLPCSSGNYLYWNASCENACNTPLITGTKNGVLTCSLPCATGDFYYLNDTTCHNACDAPLLSGSLEGGALLTCNLPCSSGNYLYWNASCENTCNPPLIAGTKNGVLTCALPCLIGQWYCLNDSSCYSACNSPLVGSSQGDLKLCSSPCLSTEYYFLDNSTCISSCTSPLVSGQIGILRTCSSTSNSGSSSQTKSQLTLALQDVTQTTSSVAVVNNLLNPTSSTSLLVLMLFDLLNYIQYMDIAYPSQVEALFDANSDMFSISFSFEYNVTSILESQLPERPIPEIFHKRGLSSSFVVNNWDPLTSMLFAVIAVILYYPLRNFVFKKIQNSSVIFLVNKLENVFRWNLFITFLISDYAEITLYSALQFISFKASSFLAVFSLLLAIFMILIGLNYLWKMLEISSDITKKPAPDSREHEENHSDEPEEAEDKWKAYEPLYEPYKNKSMWTQSYMFVLSVRIILCYTVIAALYRHPILQSVLLSLLSLTSLVYIIILKPMKELGELVENLVFEIIILMVNVCVMVIAVLESQEGDHSAEINNLGTAIVAFNTTARILATIFVFYGVCAKIYELYHERRKEIRKLTLRLKKTLKSFLNRKSLPNSPDNQSEMKLQASAKRRTEKKISVLEAALNIIRRLFRLNSKAKQVSPEPEEVSITAKPIPSRKARIVPLLSARRNIHNKPLFVATDVLVPADERSLGNDSHSSKNPINHKQFSEDFFSPNSNKSLLTRRWGGRGSNLGSPPHELVDLGTNSATSHSLGDFSQSIHSLVKSEKLKTRSYIFDDHERSLPQLSLHQQRTSKSIFNPVSLENFTQKTLKSGLIGSLYLESPTGNNSDVASSMQNLINRSPKNGRLSPQSQFIEGPGRSLELQKEVNLEKMNFKNSRRVILETIPEKPKKKVLEGVFDVKLEDDQVNPIDKVNNLV